LTKSHTSTLIKSQIAITMLFIGQNRVKKWFL